MLLTCCIAIPSGKLSTFCNAITQDDFPFSHSIWSFYLLIDRFKEKTVWDKWAWKSCKLLSSCSDTVAQGVILRPKIHFISFLRSFLPWLGSFKEKNFSGSLVRRSIWFKNLEYPVTNRLFDFLRLFAFVIVSVVNFQLELKSIYVSCLGEKFHERAWQIVIRLSLRLLLWLWCFMHLISWYIGLINKYVIILANIWLCSSHSVSQSFFANETW